MMNFIHTSSMLTTLRQIFVGAAIALSIFSLAPATTFAQGIPSQYMETLMGETQQKEKVTGADGQSGPIQKGIIVVMGHVLQAVQSLFSVLVYAGGLALNASIYYSVVKMGEFMNTSPGLAIAWGTFRDIGNIVIVFGFIAIGIATILNSEQYQAKKLLATLLIVAVAINFSSFISRAIVDTGNIVALQFYKAINGGAPVDTFLDVGISGRFIEATKLMSIYDSSTLPDSVRENLGTSLPIIAFVSIILYVVVAFVFFAIAILFISRMVILLFLITISPLAFAAMAIPRLKGQASKWWSALIDNTIVAPLLILLLWVSIKVVGDGSLTSGLGSWANVGTPVWANVLIMFGITCGFFLASLLIAKNLSAFGAGFATSMGAKIVFGGGARLTSLVGGGLSRAGRFGLQRSRFKDRSWARPVAGALRFAEGMNLDGRRLPGVGGVLSAVGAGKGATPGKASWNDMNLTEKLNLNKRYENALEASNKQYDSEMREIEEDRKNKSLVDAANNPNAALSPTDLKHLSSLSVAELSELKEIKEGNQKLVENLSPEQFESLMKSDKLTEAEKDSVKETRYAPLRAAVASGVGPDIKKVLNNMSKGEREQMPSDVLSNPSLMRNLNDKQRDELQDSKHRTAAERQNVKSSNPVNRVEAIFNSNAQNGPARAAAVLRSALTPKQIAKLPPKILKDPAIVQQFTAATLGAIEEEGKLKTGDIAAITAEIQNSGNAALIRYITRGPGAAYWS